MRRKHDWKRVTNCGPKTSVSFHPISVTVLELPGEAIQASHVEQCLGVGTWKGHVPPLPSRLSPVAPSLGNDEGRRR
jgi:hypothetical protein